MSELYESQVRWRAAFDEMHERAMKAEAQLAEAREALEQQEDAIAEYYRYWTGGETRGSYDGKPERNALWAAMYKARATLSKIGGGDGNG